MKPKILVLEDNIEILSQLHRMADRLGFDFEPARSISKALELAKKDDSRIAAVLVDMMVPRNEKAVEDLDQLAKERDQTLGVLIPADGREPSKGDQVAAGKQLEDVDAKETVILNQKQYYPQRHQIQQLVTAD